MNKGITLYGYIRQSKDDGGKGYSLDYQREVGEKVQLRLGFKNFVLLNEGSGISGTQNPLERKVCSQLIERIENGEIKNLFIYEWSRLSRDNYYSEYLRKIFKENEINLFEGDCSEPKDLNNPIDQLTSSIISSIYTFERQNMIKRIKEGLYQSRLNQKWSGVYLPYGYTKDETRKVVLDEIEVPIYLKMVDLIFEGISIRGVVNWLNDNSIPTKSNRVIKKGFIEYLDQNGTRKERNTNLMLWRDTVVRNILTNSYYKGVRIDKNGDEFPFPKIITEDKWNRLQKKIDENKSRNRTGNKKIHNYLLKNLLFCKRDGEKLLGRIKKDERTYYCNRKRKEIRLKGEPPCSLPSPNLDKLELFVWDKLTYILSNSHIIKEEYKSQILGRKFEDNPRESLEKDLSKSNKQLNQIKDKKSRLLGLLLENLVDKETYELEYNRLKQNEQGLTDEIENIQNNLIITSDSSTWIDWVDKFSEEVKGWNLSKDFKYCREKVLKYIKKIIVDYDEVKGSYVIEIILNYPIIGDKIVWKNKKDKSEGYNIKKGNKKLKYKNRLTTYQSPNNGCGIGWRRTVSTTGRNIIGA
jgi:site-specific DNA recombinase